MDLWPDRLSVSCSLYVGSGQDVLQCCLLVVDVVVFSSLVVVVVVALVPLLVVS